MVRTHKKTFQYYEVTCSGEFWNGRYPPRRFLPRSKDALSRALAYARQVSAESAAVTTVDAVYRLGATGQSTTPVAGFQRGHETFATYHPPLAVLPPAAGKAGRASGTLTGFDLFEDHDAPSERSRLHADDFGRELGPSYAHSADRLLGPKALDLLAGHMVYHYIKSRTWAVDVKPGVDLQAAGKTLFKNLVGKRSLTTADPFLHDMRLYVVGPHEFIVVEPPTKPVKTVKKGLSSGKGYAQGLTATELKLLAAARHNPHGRWSITTEVKGGRRTYTAGGRELAAAEKLVDKGLFRLVSTETVRDKINGVWRSFSERSYELMSK